jgi:hypothetical protein
MWNILQYKIMWLKIINKCLYKENIGISLLNFFKYFCYLTTTKTHLIYIIFKIISICY